MATNGNSKRNDPYRNFKFKIMWDGKYVAGLSKCSALKKTTEAVDWREAGDNSVAHRLPAKTSYEPITLEAGITQKNTDFEEWANLVNNYENNSTTSLENFRKETITIDVFDLDNKKVLSYAVYDCWVSEYQALPQLDTSGNAVMIQTIKIENEGWKRQEL